MLADRPQHFAINKGMAGRIDQFQFEAPGLRYQADIKVGMGFHQCLAVVSLDAGIENRQRALAEQPVKAAFAAVLEAVDLMIGENFKAALW